MRALLPANCSICRGSSSSVSAKKRKNTNKVRAYLFVVRSTQNKWCCRTGALHLTLRVLFVCYVRYARCPQMLCACVSLCLRSVGRSPSCAKMRRAKYRTQASVSAKKEKHEKFVLIFLWCGHRDLNSDGVTIRPSNVRVCLFRHDRLTLLII